jgi:hypothetical protein
MRYHYTNEDNNHQAAFIHRKKSLIKRKRSRANGARSWEQMAENASRPYARQSTVRTLPNQ